MVAVVLAFLLIATFPGDYREISPGLDPSWTYALNVLPHTDFRFGHDVVFTFGPLGYLLAPHHVESNLAQAAVMWILLQVGMALGAVYHYRRHRRVTTIVAFGAVYLLAMGFGLNLEDRLLILLAVGLSVPPEDRRVWRYVAPASAIAAGFLLLVKLTPGLAAFSMLVLVTAVWMLQRRVTLRSVALYLFLPYAVVVVGAGSVLTGGPVGLLLWLRDGAEIVRGFSGAMAFAEPPLLPIVALLGMAAWTTVVVLGIARHGSLTAIALSLAPVVFFAFRHSFVRHHGRFIFPVLLAATALLILAGGDRRRLVAGLTAASLVLSGAVVVGLQPECGCSFRPSHLGPVGWSNLASMVRWEETTGRLDEQSAVSLASDRLPGEWVAEMNAESSTVDAVPWEIAFMAANGLRWRPNPVIQTYHAYTPRLDRRVAEHFSGTDAPAYLLSEYSEIDGRHPLFASPRMWRAILGRYEPAREVTTSGEIGRVALLQQRSQALPMAGQRIGSTESPVGTWVDVPQRDALLFAHIELDSGLRDFLAQAFWRIDPMYIDLDYGDGGFVRVRVLPATLGGGPLLNRPPLTIEEFMRLLQGRLLRPVLRFRVTGPGTGVFGDAMRVVWREVQWPAPSP